MQRVGDKLAQSILLLLGLALIVLMFLGLWNIISRHLFGKAVLWADEITVFGVIILTWIGAAISAWRGSEIRMGLFIDTLPTRIQNRIEALQHFLVSGLCAWVTYLSWTYVSRLFQFGMTSDAAQIPSWTVHISVTIGLGLIALIAFLRFAKIFSMSISRHNINKD